MRLLVFALVGTTLLLGSTARAEGGIIDQVCLYDAMSISLDSGATAVWQQGVTAGISGELLGVDLYSRANETGSFNFFINKGSPWQTDANDFETVVAVTTPVLDDWFYVDTSAAGISLTAGETFTIGLQGGISGNVSVGGAVHWMDPYSGGQLFKDGGVYAPPPAYEQRDLAFRTHMSPEPSGVAALVSMGAMALAGYGWRRRRRKG